MVQMFLECSDCYGSNVDVNSSEQVSFTTRHIPHESCYEKDQEFIGISHTQRKHYWEKESWEEIDNVAVANIKKATPLSVALAIGNEEIIALLKQAGATSHPENATVPVTYNWNLKTNFLKIKK